MAFTGFNFVVVRRSDIRKTFISTVNRQDQRIENYLQSIRPLKNQIKVSEIEGINLVFNRCYKDIFYLLECYPFLQKPRYYDTIHAERRECKEKSQLSIEADKISQMMEALSIAGMKGVPFQEGLNANEIAKLKNVTEKKIGEQVGLIENKILICLDLAKRELSLGQRVFRWFVFPAESFQNT